MEIVKIAAAIAVKYRFIENPPCLGVKGYFHTLTQTGGLGQKLSDSLFTLQADDG